MKKLKEIIKRFLSSLLNLFKDETNKTLNQLDDEINALWGWLLWIGEKNTDYLLWSWDDFKKKIAEKYRNWEWDLKRDLIYEYNQGAQYETRNWCTIYSAITELSYLLDRKFSLCEIQRVWHKMIKDWKLDPNYWAYLSDAIDYVRRDWNEHNPENQVESYRFQYSDTKLLQALDKYVIRPTQLWYRTSSDLSKQIRNNPYIATDKNYPKKGWHAVTRFKGKIIDNYKREDNKNKYKFEHLQDLIKNKVVFNNWYIFLKK